MAQKIQQNIDKWLHLFSSNLERSGTPIASFGAQGGLSPWYWIGGLAEWLSGRGVD